MTVSGGIKPRYPQFFEYLVLPIDDNPEENLKKYFKQSIDFIDQALSSSPSTRVLIHCAAGISRSGGITCAYLMWCQRWSFDTAWLYGRSTRPKMYPNLGFQRQLRQWENEIGVDKNKDDDINRPFKSRSVEKKEEVKSDEAEAGGEHNEEGGEGLSVPKNEELE